MLLHQLRLAFKKVHPPARTESCPSQSSFQPFQRQKPSSFVSVSPLKELIWSVCFHAQNAFGLTTPTICSLVTASLPPCWDLPLLLRSGSFSAGRRASLLGKVCQGSTGQQDTRSAPEILWLRGSPAPILSCHCSNIERATLKLATLFPALCLGMRCSGLYWQRRTTADLPCRAQRESVAWKWNTDGSEIPPKPAKTPPVSLTSHYVSLFRASLFTIWLWTAGKNTCTYSSRDKPGTYKIETSGGNTKSNCVPQELRDQPQTSCCKVPAKLEKPLSWSRHQFID